ncbi:MAG: hypothetical protein K2M04_04295 [Muribaculaceae bacterium]|nr:hypothetical protein [Muribaculaceae bacterium]
MTTATTTKASAEEMTAGGSDESTRRRAKVVAIVLAVIFHAGIIWLMINSFLRYPPPDVDIKELEERSEIVFGGEFVMLGNTPDQAAVSASDEPAPQLADNGTPSLEATDMTNEGAEPGEPAPVVTTTAESPMKVKETPKPEKSGPTQAEIEAAEKAKREKEQAEKIKNQMKFGTSGTGAGSAGSPDGNANSGAVAGQAGHDLAGRTVASWGKNSSTKSGEIRIAVKVNAQGHVVSATYAGGSGPASADPAIRQRCVAAAKASRFSVRNGSPEDQTGVITWRFK